MIYVASLAAPVKRAYGELCMNTSVPRIIEQMPLDPKVSNMDVVVLGVKDVAGINRTKVQSAVKSKNPDVCVIYIYSKEKEGEIIDIPFKKCLKKITPDTIKTVIDEFIGEQSISSSNVMSRDNYIVKEEPKEKEHKRRITPVSGVKGNLLKNTEEAEEEVEENPIQVDDVLGLKFKENFLGEREYFDTAGKKMSPAQLQSYKDKAAAKMEEEAAAAAALEEATGFTRGDDDDDDLVVNVPGRSSDKPRTKVEKVTIYVDDNGNEVGPNYPGAHTEVVSRVVPNEEYQPKSTPRETFERTKSNLEKNIEEIRNFHDWGYFKEAMSKDAIVRELLEENATYQGTVQMLNVLDAEIKGIYYDRGLSASQKFEKIMEIGGKRAQLMAVHNDIISKKVIDIIDAITISARRTVEDLVADNRDAIETLNKKDLDLMDESQVNDVISKRSSIIVELMAAYRGVISLLQVLEVDVREYIVDLDKNLPSDNEFINQMFGSSAQLLIPTNTEEIANKLMGVILDTVSSKPGSLAAIGKYIRDFISSTVELLKSDQEIIEHQQNLIRLLKAHRVEDAVVIDGILKNILNVYIGADDTGRTATTLTWSGVLSRRRNTLLVDMSDNSKLMDYGVKPVDLHTFLNERIDRPLCVVAGQPVDMEELMEVVRELKTRLDYYAHINVVFDDTQIVEAAAVSDEALSVNFITNCTNASIETMKNCYAKINMNNIARKLIMIDRPVSVLEIAKRIGVDPTMTKCVTIPNMLRIKTCAVMNDAPYEYDDVRSIYEEAFR